MPREHTCDHWLRNPESGMRSVKCGKPVKWEVEAWAVVYGVPSTGYFCDEHIDANRPGTFPKINSYPLRPLQVKRIGE